MSGPFYECMYVLGAKIEWQCKMQLCGVSVWLWTVPPTRLRRCAVGMDGLCLVFTPSNDSFLDSQ